jgi:hypothetical protein
LGNLTKKEKMGTKLNPGKFDCYANAKEDEPMFVLLARDKFAPALVALWATMRELDGESPEKIAEARECADAMIRYQMANERQTAGLSFPTIAGMLELVRMANYQAEHAPGAGTTEEFIRTILSRTKFE